MSDSSDKTPKYTESIQAERRRASPVLRAIWSESDADYLQSQINIMIRDKRVIEMVKSFAWDENGNMKPHDWEEQKFLLEYTDVNDVPAIHKVEKYMFDAIQKSERMSELVVGLEGFRVFTSELVSEACGKAVGMREELDLKGF